MEHAAQVLSLRPEWDFGKWLEELRERPEKNPP